jgi:N-acetylmuramoyl-L-alanine amidase
VTCVCIDPGHQKLPDLHLEPVAPGAKIFKPRCAPGTRGIRTDTPEYEVVLQVASRAALQLKKSGYGVILTRQSNDVLLSNIERAQIANEAKVDLCIKIHCNGVRESLRWLGRWRRGLLTLVPARSVTAVALYNASYALARVLHAHLLKATTFPDLGIQPRDDLTGFNWSRVPVVLLELGYLTNPVEEAQLVRPEFQDILAKAIASGVEEVFNDT